jgi:hypothetical protein
MWPAMGMSQMGLDRMSLVWVSFRSHTLDRDETESVPNRDRLFWGLKLRPRFFEGEMSRKRH